MPTYILLSRYTQLGVANKLEWVEQLPDTDHVARMRVRDRNAHPERLDDLVAEIAMGRSILER